jgi:hypothetical protein
MSELMKQLIDTERRRADFGFITETVQRGKNRPKKYKHDITMPVFLYEELRNRGIIDPSSYFIDESAFFEFSNSEATISFISLFACEDLHRKIDHYLVVKFAGSYPLTRGGRFF